MKYNCFVMYRGETYVFENVEDAFVYFDIDTHMHYAKGFHSDERHVDVDGLRVYNCIPEYVTETFYGVLSAEADKRYSKDLAYSHTARGRNADFIRHNARVWVERCFDNVDE
jgi:hypothetical protein